MGAFPADLRYAVRRLCRAPAFAAFTLALLATAIGANTAIFSLINTLSLRDLPAHHPEQLVHVAVPTSSAAGEAGLSISAFREIARRQQVFSALVGWESFFWGNVDIDGQLSRENPWFVTANFYAELGARPFLGRLLSPDDEGSAGTFAPVSVVGYNYWRRRLRGDPGAIGRTVRIEDIPFVIIGVAPQHFSGFGLGIEPDLTIPNNARAVVEAATGDVFDPDLDRLSVVGRLKPGITLGQASAQLTAQWPDVKEASVPRVWDDHDRAEFLATGLLVTSAEKGADQALRSDLVSALTLAMAGAALILLIACLNLAGLVLSRVAVGHHEWSVRASLGATRWQLARPVLLEVAILTLGGASGGVPIAAWGIAAFRRWSLGGVFPTTVPVGIAPDSRVLIFVSAVVLIVGLLVSAAAIAWLARRPHNVAMPKGARTTRHFLSPVLVTTQITLSLVLIATSTLLARNIQELRSTRNLHYRRDGVTVFTLRPRPNGDKNLDNDIYQPALLEEIRAIPGVRAASLGQAPAPGLGFGLPVSSISGGTAGTAPEGFASPGFFQTLEIPFVGGRDFAWRDDSHAPRVVIVSRSLAHHLFGDEGAVGRHIRIGTETRDQDREVVGVVADAKLFDFQHATPFAVYTAQLQSDSNFKHVLIRTDVPSGAITAQVTQVVASFGHEYVERTRTLEQRTDDDFANEWLVAQLAACFSTIALVLTAIGLYSLLSYAVVLRRRELGIRLALGAEPRRLIAFVAADGLKLAIAGILCGIAGTWVTNRMLASRLAAVGPFNPLTLIASPLLLLSISVIACTGPAIRAARIDPIVTLRVD